MPGNCYRFALETFLDLYADLSSGSVIIGANQCVFEPHFRGDAATIRNENLPALGPNPVLVHGFPFGQAGNVKDQKIGHAWIEGNGYVVDCGTLEKTLWLTDRDAYYELGRIDPQECHHYTVDQVIGQIVATGRDGWWNELPAEVSARLSAVLT
ncbi:MAG: hypothetical protein WD894_24525 [Pirellulales bacterium]